MPTASKTADWRKKLSGIWIGTLGPFSGVPESGCMPENWLAPALIKLISVVSNRARKVSRAFATASLPSAAL